MRTSAAVHARGCPPGAFGVLGSGFDGGQAGAGGNVGSRGSDCGLLKKPGGAGGAGNRGLEFSLEGEPTVLQAQPRGRVARPEEISGSMR